MPRPYSGPARIRACYRLSVDAADYNAREYREGRLTERHVADFVRAYQKANGLAVDGKAGPDTRAHLSSSPPPRPRNRSEVWEVFGTPGTLDPLQANQAWAEANIVECHESHGNRLPGVPAGLYVHVNRRIESLLRGALGSVTDPVERLGGYVYRLTGSGSGNLSYHSWGIAVDLNPADNSARRFDGRRPSPWSDEWLAIWPRGVSRRTVDAFEAHGFIWGGWWTSFCDPMHFQYVG